MRAEDRYRLFEGAQGGFAIRVCGEVTLTERLGYIEFLRQTEARLLWWLDGEWVETAEWATRGLAAEQPARLRISLAGIELDWGLAPSSVIELRFDPRRVRSRADLVLLFRTMSTLGRQLGREAEMVDGGGRRLFDYRPGGKGVRYVGSDGPG